MASGPWHSRSILVVLGMSALAFAQSVGSGLAQSGACETAFGKPAPAATRPSPVHWRKLERAIAKQLEQLDLALQRKERTGCSWGQSDRQDCLSLARSVERMERNLGSLERQQAALEPSAAESDPLDEPAALHGQDCADPAELDLDVTVAEREGLLAEVDPLGDGSGDSDAPERETSGQSHVYRILGPTEILAGVKPYRTTCVRACDGYYFPMSPASSPNDFGRDQDRCEAACPDADVRLYVQESDQEDAGNMMSAATGESYGSFPNAFLYRQTEWKQPASCGCGARKGFSIVSGVPAPETVGPLPETPKAASPADREKSAEPAGNRKVRVVLPGFLPDPSTAATPQAPARSEAP